MAQLSAPLRPPPTLSARPRSTSRWRAETNKLHAMLKKAQGEMGRKGEEMSKLRAQNITWSSDNKQRRAEAGTLV